MQWSIEIALYTNLIHLYEKKMADSDRAGQAVCLVCLRKICLTSSGVIRSHGPAGRRCKGAGKPPKVINSNSGEPQEHDNPPSQSQLSESLVPIPIEAHQGVVECLPDVTVVKRIPKCC